MSTGGDSHVAPEQAAEIVQWARQQEVEIHRVFKDIRSSAHTEVRTRCVRCSYGGLVAHCYGKAYSSTCICGSQKDDEANVHAKTPAVQSTLKLLRACAEKYNMNVVKVPGTGFRQKFQQPRADSKVGGYVTLLDSSGENVPGKNILLDMSIHGGHHGLQEVAEHVNAKIGKLLRENKDTTEGVPKVWL